MSDSEDLEYLHEHTSDCKFCYAFVQSVASHTKATDFYQCHECDSIGIIINDKCRPCLNRSCYYNFDKFKENSQKYLLLLECYEKIRGNCTMHDEEEGDDND
jgi:hypothetical protein